MAEYSLRITFKSNEHPFSTDYKPIPWAPPKDDAEAIEWARDMAAGMGGAYVVTLIGDGKIIDYSEAPNV